MKTNFMGKCYAGMNSMVTGMKRSNLNEKPNPPAMLGRLEENVLGMRK